MTENFWKGETCEYCGGEIVEKHVTMHRKVKGNYVLLENVPAGVCTQCGTRYYSANVLKPARTPPGQPGDRCTCLRLAGIGCQEDYK